MPAVKPPDPIPGARLLFTLDPAVSHFNHGSFGAVPAPVQRAQQRLRDEMEANPLRFFASGALYDRVTAARRYLAAFAGLDPDGTALVANTTTGVSVVLDSLRLRAGDEIVCTDHGYGGVSLATARTCRETGAVIRTAAVPLSPRGDEVVTAVRAGMSSRTKLVIIDRITSSTVQVLPVTAVIAVARERGVPVFVDAAHAPGLLAETVAADFWIGSVHKWGYAPRGTALLNVAPQWRDRIRSPVVSWREPDGFPGSLEFAGSADYTPWLAAPVGAYVLRTLGVDTVRRHNAALAVYAQSVVGEALGVAPADLLEPVGGVPVPMRIVPLPPGLVRDPDDATRLRRRIADELQTEVAVNHWRGSGLLRLSAQVYNQAEEYDRFAERLPGFLRGVQRQ